MADPDPRADDIDVDPENVKGIQQQPDSNGGADLRAQVRHLSLSLSSEIKKRRHIEDSLATTVETLSRENRRLNEQEAKEWRLPNLVLSGLTCMGGILVILLGLHVGSQFQTTFSLNQRSHEIHEEVTAAAKDRMNTMAMFRDEMDRVDTMRADMQETLADFQSKYETQMELARTQVSELESESKTLQRIGTASSNVLPTLAFADVSMSVAHDYDQAAALAFRAEKELRDIRQELATIGNTSPAQRELVEKLDVQLQTLWHKAMTIACQCHLNKGDIDAARGLVAELTNHPLANERSLLLQGLVNLNDCCMLTDRNTIVADARAAQKLIQSSLELHSRNNTNGSVANSNRLYLAATLLLGQEYDAANTIVQDFIEKRMEGIEGTYRLSSVDKASLELAELLLTISSAMSQPMMPLPDFECKLNVGSLTPHDGRLFERVVVNLVQSRNNVFPDDRARANEFGLLGVKTVLALRSACADRMMSQACAGCGAPASGGNNGYRQDADELLAHLGLWPSAKYPIPHMGGQFVSVDAGSRRLRRVIFDTLSIARSEIVTVLVREERTRVVTLNGQEVEQPYTVLVPQQQTIERTYDVARPAFAEVVFPNGLEIPPDLYVPFDITVEEFGFPAPEFSNSGSPVQNEPQLAPTPDGKSVMEPGSLPQVPDET